jgi:hypothetical protein
MDAPPARESISPFLHAAEVARDAGVRVPQVFASDIAAGWMALEDLGSTTFLQALNQANAPALYQAAWDSLLPWQCATRPDVFPSYDTHRLRQEVDLLRPWYFERHCGATLRADEQQVLEQASALIVERCVHQPQVYVHRDFHSRNLMVLPDDQGLGVLDFQDAVIGPITYDPVSLLRDAYVQWDEAQQIDWLIRYWEQARAKGLPVNADFGEFYRDFEWMGLQRHLKVLGIFARLHYRDAKEHYLNDIPVVLDYTMKVLQRYNELGPLRVVFERVLGTRPEVGYTF